MGLVLALLERGSNMLVMSFEVRYNGRVKMPDFGLVRTIGRTDRTDIIEI